MNTLFALCLLLGADMYQQTFDEAGQAYRSGDLPTAIARYEQLVGSSVESSVLFYNLGNAYYRNGELGKAVAEYERALQLDPQMEAARQNLETVLKQTKRNLARPLRPDWEQALFFWDEDLSEGTVLKAGLLLWLLFWCLLAAGIWLRRRWVNALSAGVLAVALLALGSAWTKSHPVTLAVAAQAEVSVYFGKNPDDEPRFLLYEGDRVRLERQEGEWALIVTAGGDRGWAQSAQLAQIGPPHAPLTTAKAGPP